MAQEMVVNTEALNGAGETNGAAKTNAVSFMSLKPQLVVAAPRAADAVQFYKSAFGAEEVKRENHPKRKAEQEKPLILCAELKLGTSVIQVCDQVVDDSADALVSSGPGSGFTLCLETDDVDAAVKKAVEAGGVAEGGEISATADGGETGCCGGVGRVGKVKDPFGYVWCFCSPAAAAAAADAPQIKVVDVEA